MPWSQRPAKVLTRSVLLAQLPACRRAVDERVGVLPARPDCLGQVAFRGVESVALQQKHPVVVVDTSHLGAKRQRLLKSPVRASGFAGLGKSCGEVVDVEGQVVLAAHTHRPAWGVRFMAPQMPFGDVLPAGKQFVVDAFVARRSQQDMVAQNERLERRIGPVSECKDRGGQGGTRAFAFEKRRGLNRPGFTGDPIV